MRASEREFNEKQYRGNSIEAVRRREKGERIAGEGRGGDTPSLPGRSEACEILMKPGY